MLKLPDIAGINPVARILPLIAVEKIGEITQELGDRATQFEKGREYTAQVLSKVGDTAYHVKVDVDGLKSTILKMDLGAAAQSGQAISLRYMQDSPIPTFLLTSTPNKSIETTADISSAARLIGSYLQAAEEGGVSNRFEATTVVTQNPANSQILAQDLKLAVSKSGLFYESHLSDLVQNGQNLVSIKQEPQNQNNSVLATLVSQQLAILENQRLSWHGSVWPGQKMDWDIYLQQGNVDESNRHSSHQMQSEVDARPIVSEMTLQMPRLGEVTVRLNLADGRLRINIVAANVQTLEILKGKRQSLAEAIVKNGQQLDALTVIKHD
jgi:hypothetical protein